MQWEHALTPGQTRYNALEYMQWPTHVEKAPGAYARKGDGALFLKGNFRDGFMLNGGKKSGNYMKMALYWPGSEVDQGDDAFGDFTSAHRLFELSGGMFSKQV